MILSVVLEESTADQTRIAGWSIEPRMSAEVNLASSNPNPLLRQPVSEDSAGLRLPQAGLSHTIPVLYGGHRLSWGAGCGLLLRRGHFVQIDHMSAIPAGLVDL